MKFLSIASAFTFTVVASAAAPACLLAALGPQANLADVDSVCNDLQDAVIGNITSACSSDETVKSAYDSFAETCKAKGITVAELNSDSDSDSTYTSTSTSTSTDSTSTDSTSTTSSSVTGTSSSGSAKSTSGSISASETVSGSSVSSTDASSASAGSVMPALTIVVSGVLAAGLML